MGGGYGIVWEIVLYGDAACTIELGRTRASIPYSPFAGPFVGGISVPISTIRIPRNYPVYAKVACSYAYSSATIAVLYKDKI